MAMKKSFGEFLVDLGVITGEQLKKASEEQKIRQERLEKTIIRKGYAKDEVIFQCLANYYDLPYVDLDTYLIDEQVLKIVPEDIARRHTIIPIFKIGDRLTVAMENPLNLPALDELRNRTKMEIEIVISTENKIRKAIEQHYGSGITKIEDTLKQSVLKSDIQKESEAPDYRKSYELELKESIESLETSSTTKMFDLIMIQAIRDRASDIHLEPDEKSLRVRFRIDGYLFETLTLPKAIHPAITSRIKILAEMDIAETRLPQDGNFNVKMGDRGFEIRVSTFPTIYGENVVLRILDQTSPLLSLEDLGFSEDMLIEFRNLLRRPNGIILVTGPTGSGKTTTLYACLNIINTVDKNIITIEDPVEYRLPLIRQTQVNPKAGITFATGLRSILRQDPDVIMVGEIRDLETAEIAVQAALTGHLVLSTLHTNDAPEAITRLLDIGVEPYLISSALIGVLAQRLVRIICPHCKTSIPLDDRILKEFGDLIKKTHQEPTLFKGKGCKQCKQSGYLGRTGIFELLIVNEKIKRLISERASTQLIREVAREELGLRSLREDGLLKVLKGVTTLNEIDRVAYLN